ncbi:MAG: hypothetical protein SOZ59_13255 [Candidatus Limivivens sp.]|nr:hypothetical protein [Candidatus Limivivens sp.]
MRKRHGFFDRLGRKVYEKRKINRKILTVKKSFDEVNGILNGRKK